ncbi:MAG: alkaline phosphatase family protein [Actinobacteria bacterium]|nr:alkaline phosphatase family protein [Actinomycetota bacterium]
MSRFDRRRFLQGAATSVGGAAVAASLPGVTGAARAFGQEEPDPCLPPGLDLTIPPSTLPPDPADNPIEHIGVLMMENRSYDTYFGWYDKGRGFLNLGLDLTYTDPDTGSTASPMHRAPEYRRRPEHPDPDHGWGAGRDQLANGFLDGRNDEYALSYYLPEDIPYYARLARQFTLFDDYYCAVLGPTYPNREYMHSAQSGGLKSNALPPQVPGHETGFTWPTIWDRLEAAGISWGYYYVDLPAIGLFGLRHMHKAFHVERFFLDAATGNLPQVYFVDPGFLGSLRTDDHPSGADMRASQAWVNNLIHAVVTGPQWDRHAFFVNYDEWGGFFDHVRPPRVPDDRANADDIDEDFGQLGFRVPCLAISPYSRKGYVHHDGPFEHTSILRFIEYRYDLEPLTLRDARANNIGEAFDYEQAPRLEIGIDQVETPTLFFSSGEEHEVPGPTDDFQRLAAWVTSQGWHVPASERRAALL